MSVCGSLYHPFDRLVPIRRFQPRVTDRTKLNTNYLAHPSYSGVIASLALRISRYNKDERVPFAVPSFCLASAYP